MGPEHSQPAPFSSEEFDKFSAHAELKSVCLFVLLLFMLFFIAFLSFVKVYCGKPNTKSVEVLFGWKPLRCASNLFPICHVCTKHLFSTDANVASEGNSRSFDLTPPI
jgi:hypothetical protein